jgi:hypothetical protein
MLHHVVDRDDAGLVEPGRGPRLERALAEKMTSHLGCEKHDLAGRESGNSRNVTAHLIRGQPPVSEPWR